MRPHANVSVLLYSFKTLISISSDKSNSRQRHHWLFDYEWISEIAVPSFKFHGKHRNILGGYSAHQAFGVCVCDLASLKLVYCNYQVRDFRIKAYFDLVVYDLLYVWYCVAKKGKKQNKKEYKRIKEKAQYCEKHCIQNLNTCWYLLTLLFSSYNTVFINVSTVLL